MTKAEYGEQAAAARTLLDARFAKWKEGDEWQKRELCKALDARERRIRLEEMYIGKMGPVKNVITQQGWREGGREGGSGAIYGRRASLPCR